MGGFHSISFCASCMGILFALWNLTGLLCPNKSPTYWRRQRNDCCSCTLFERILFVHNSAVQDGNSDMEYCPIGSWIYDTICWFQHTKLYRTNGVEQRFSGHGTRWRTRRILQVSSYRRSMKRNSSVHGAWAEVKCISIFKLEHTPSNIMNQFSNKYFNNCRAKLQGCLIVQCTVFSKA
jgi:hypothetical protein